ncbi:MAG TPA: sigma-70 family RNA polymerase sigma factor [Steroidobacteraceae bacterium]|nr:sigma-70 family RNA polymerase sigma factor [Steroidobacteraceae bacterium]
MNQQVAGTDRNRRFARLCEPLRADLYRFAFWLSRDPQIADDVVQETMLRAWKSLDRLQEDSAAKQWLLTIARREHARLYERKRLVTVDLDEVVVDDSSALAVSHDRDTELDEVRQAIFELDDDYREPLVLQVLMGYSTQEIAEHMNLNTGAVLTRLFRARNKLRKQLGLAGDDAED